MKSKHGIIDLKVIPPAIIKVVSGRSIFGDFIFIFNIIAVLVSYSFNKSIAWAIFHYIVGIPYLLYCTLIGRFSNGGLIQIIDSYF